MTEPHMTQPRTTAPQLTAPHVIAPRTTVPRTTAPRLRATWVLYLRTLRELRALGPQTMVAPLVVPTFMLIAYSRLFAGVFARLGVRLDDTPGFAAHPHYVQYLMAGPIVLSALLGTASAGIGVAVERQLGFYDRMELSPLGPSLSQFGRRLGDGTRIAFFVTVLLLVARASGAAILNWPLALAVVVPLTAALGMAWGGLAFSLCLRKGSAEAAQAVTPLSMPLVFLSSAFVPAALVPGWMRHVVHYNPLTAVCDTIRQAAAGRVSGAGLLHSVLVVAALGALTQVLVVRAEHKVRAR
ncbi:ABC-2 type transporter [Actinobacteria bacterium OK074]|nr:ABC-2 type transporter [Actinobacteria bacterium OK074]